MNDIPLCSRCGKARVKHPLFGECKCPKPQVKVTMEPPVVAVLRTGLEMEGAHHKQWALWRVAELLGLAGELGDIEDRGNAP